MADDIDGLFDDGDSRFDEFGPAFVIESGDGEVVRRFFMGVSHGADGAHKEQAVTGDDGMRCGGGFQPLRCFGFCGGDAGGDEFGIGREAEAVHGVHIAFMAFDAGGARIAEKSGDVAVALGVEMFDERGACGVIVEHDGIFISGGAGAVDQDDGEAWFLPGEPVHAGAGRGEDDSGNAFFFHQFEVERFAFGVLVRIAQNDAQPGFIGGVLHRAADSGEERI